MNPYLTQRANRRWWVYPLMALFFALSALLLWLSLIHISEPTRH